MLPIISRTRKLHWETKAGEKPREELAISYHQVLGSQDELTDYGQAQMRMASASWAHPSHFDADNHLCIETMSNRPDGYSNVMLSQQEAIELRKFLDHVLPVKG